MRVTLFDYGAGNLHSLGKALRTNGTVVCIEPDPVRALNTDVLILPGVGAFGAAAAALAPGRVAMRDAIIAGLPTLGICLGMQLMFEESDEGVGEGLALLGGRVERLQAGRTPQIGWNAIDDARDPLFALAALATAYYANRYVCRAVDPAVVIAWSTHENDRFPAAVRIGRAVGVQFHPEKSSSAGIEFLRRFLSEAGA
jgi:glutamine amidotransferase